MKKDEVITLDKLKKGQDAYVLSVECEDEALRSHILDMGLTPNVEVELIKVAPLGDPIELRVRGYELTLRKSDASKIKIINIHDAHNSPRKDIKFDEILEHSMVGEKGVVAKNVKPKEKIKLALVGNQNSGKTTLFNQLTGSNQRVGNFPGVTVDKKEGTVKGKKNIVITDLPGIYSLSPYSSEEIITRNFILDEKPDGIINIVDATNIERNLFLTLQLIELNIPMVIALNMMDEVQKSDGSIDINSLENALGVPIVPISASKNEGISELLEHIENVAKYQIRPKKLDFCASGDHKQGSVHRCIHSVIHIIEDHAKEAELPVRFAATKLVEGDKLINDRLRLDKRDITTCNQIIKQMENETELDKKSALCDMRFNYIEGLCSNFVSKPSETIEYKISKRVDKVLTGKYTAILAFILIMGSIFYITFGPVGTFLSDKMEALIDFVINGIDKGLAAYGLNRVVHSLIVKGFCAGIGSVLSFLPIIVILFFFLSILEDTGYMARIAFVMDKLLRKIGLSGRSIVPMLIGFGCSVPAIMATRTLPSGRDRKMTILLAPFMSCSAKLPIYALFTSAFFVKNHVEVIIGLYLIGILVGIIFAYIIKIFAFKGSTTPFVMELPNYRLPSWKNIYRLIYYRAKGFVTKAFTIIFWATIFVWFLQNFDAKLNLVSDPSYSILASIGELIVPVFMPLGIDKWQVATAFITGFMAKESVVSTLTLLVGDVSKLPMMFTQLTAFVFLVFSLLYTPCVATIATVRRELGIKYAALIIIIQCSIAWLAAFGVYNIGRMFIG